MSTTKKNTLRLPESYIYRYDAQAWTNSDVITGSPGGLVWFTAGNKSSSVLYLMFFDGVVVPNAGAVPLFMPIQLSSGTLPHAQLLMNDGPGGGRYYAEDFASGLCWAASTAPGTLTVDSTSSVWVMARYVG